MDQFKSLNKTSLTQEMDKHNQIDKSFNYHCSESCKYMNVRRTLNLLAKTYKQSIYEWPDKPSKVLVNSSLWMH